MNEDKIKTTDANRDPITGTPGAHPVGTGVGAAGAGAAGAAIGTAIGGPIGGVVGAVAGAVAGGLAGKGAAEKVNPTREDAYWRQNYTTQTYVERTRPYDDYAPAYRTGYEGYTRYSGKRFEQVEPDLQKEYEKGRGKSNLGWENAKHASRAAWERVERGGTDANRDPISGTPGAHPVGTGAGAAAGGATGAAIGTAVGGPMGGVVGAVVGAVGGGLAGKGAAEKVNPTREDAYWRENYSKQPFVEKNRAWDEYQPGFKTGYEGYTRYSGKRWDQAESDLQRDYERNRGRSTLGWDQAKNASRAAWDRCERGVDY